MVFPLLHHNLLQLACYGYFSAGILGSLCSFLAQKQFGPSTLFSHGKAADKLDSTSNWITSLTVPKHFFWHFYALGFAASIAYIAVIRDNLSAVLLSFQCFRRLVECFLVMPGAEGSRMHLIHYLIGISYYPVLLLTFYLQQNDQVIVYPQSITLVFVGVSGFQCYCHWLLGSARRKCANQKHPHRPLQNGLFKFIHTPHYFAELLIYSCIAAANHFHPLSLLNLLWIMTILGISSYNSAGWLCAQWKYRSHSDFCKYLMVPYLF